MNRDFATARPVRPILFAIPGAEYLVAGMACHWPADIAALELHRFPDHECCPCFGADLEGRDVVLVAGMGCPDAKLFELYLCARIARELGAATVGLVLPYLPYMRQDRPFQPGQGTSARHVAQLLEHCADWLVTVDPHLHRIQHLEELFAMPALVAPAAEPIAQWIAANVERPVLVGPDGESAQWVAQVSGLLGCPFVVMNKERRGDHDVTVSLQGAGIPAGHTPVLLDDIASSGHTLAGAIAALRATGAAAPVCVIVHAVFADDALEVVHRAGSVAVVSCNTVAHSSNCIDISAPLARAAALLASGAHIGEPA